MDKFKNKICKLIIWKCLTKEVSQMFQLKWISNICEKDPSILVDVLLLRDVVVFVTEKHVNLIYLCVYVCAKLPEMIHPAGQIEIPGFFILPRNQLERRRAESFFEGWALLVKYMLLVQLSLHSSLPDSWACELSAVLTVQFCTAELLACVCTFMKQEVTTLCCS